MIKYRLKSEYGDTVLDTILKNRNITIEEADRIISPKKSCLESPLNFTDMYRAINIFKLALNNNLKIGILVDNDCDGMASSSMIYDFIKNVLGYSNVDYIIHENKKAHGLNNKDVMKAIYDKEIQLMIVPDAGTNDIEEHKELISNGIHVLILDHHLQEIETIPEVILVNPHTSNNIQNKNQSGTMVVYKFIQAYCLSDDTIYSISKKYTDLVAVSLIADVCDMTEYENRHFFNLGRQKRNLSNNLLREYFKEIDTEELLIEDIAFKVSPYVNATIRLGETSDRDMLFRAFANFEDAVPYKKRGTKEPIIQDLATAMVRISKSIKAKQDKEVKKSVEVVKDYINTNNLNNNKILFINATNLTSSEINGLVANKIMSEYRKPVALLREYNDSVGGSGRGITNCKEIPSFKELLESTGLINCMGHDNAFGIIDCNINNIEKASSIIEEKLSNTSLSDDIVVDYIYERNVPVEDVIKVSDYVPLWCNHLKEPLFIIKDVKLNSDSIKRLGSSTYIFKVGKSSFTKYFGSKVWYQGVVLEDEYPFGNVDLKLDILCAFKKNSKGFAYIDIKDIYSRVDEDILGF